MGILEEHSDVTLAVGIMFINKIPFVMATSQAICFGTAKILTIMVALRQLIEAYEARGFKILHILGNRQFEHAHKHIEKWGLF